MAYPFRGGSSQTGGDPIDDSRSRDKNSNYANNNDSRGGLTRRFTMTAMPTLSPIGQQRRQAAGDLGMVSTMHSLPVGRGQEVVGSGYGSSTGTGKKDVTLDERQRFLKMDAAAGCRVQTTAEHQFENGLLPMLEAWVSEITAQQGQQEEPCCYGGNTATTMLTCSKQSVGGYGRTVDRRSKQIEDVIQLQRRLNAQMEQLDPDAHREVEASIRHESAVNQLMAQSEPTTPPEYQDAFPTALSRPNRYSTASITSPPGIATRPNRSSTQLTSPSGGFVRPYTANASNLPSQSVPGSRRHSDDEEEEEDYLYRFETGVHRAAANPNRNSMPVTSYGRKRNTTDISSAYGPVNTTSFLFDEDEKPSFQARSSTKTSPDTKTYLQVQHTADGFPKLIRREDHSEVFPGSAALDLALQSQKPNGEQLTDRSTAARHRISLPPSALSSGGNIAPLNSILANASDIKPPANNRRSMEVKFSADTKRPSLLASPPRANGSAMSQISYTKSTNDIPTLKSINGDQSGGVPLNSPPNQFSILANTNNNIPAEQNTESLTRVTSGTNSNRQSRDFNNFNGKNQETSDFFNPSTQTNLQANAQPFGPLSNQDMPSFNGQAVPFNGPAYYGGYGMNMLNNGFGNMNIGGYGQQGQWQNPMQNPMQNQIQQFQPGGGYGGFQQQYPNNGQAVQGAGRYHPRSGEVQQRKQQADDFYNNASVTELVDQIYGLCKDQHGCRFLQKKLEERNETDVQIIFDQVKTHFTELMTDPFGNYLCQRMLEHANDEQRTVLVRNASPELTRIALNQHGTRALQRMIEFISTPEQTDIIIEALRDDVVQLIQDLNGNHVIQKCLNHLSPQDAQFIFDAVGANCVTVGTHRHGCCVLQRCVDHASGMQKGALVNAIIGNAFSLVQDPFGNYVVQYILDLAEPAFTEPLCRSFQGNVIFLSKQKFSSNVIEKCIRCADADTRRMLIIEISSPYELEKLLRDSYANYVVQTAVDFADHETKAIIIEYLRPIVPSIRNTPYGRRIQTKIQDFDASTMGSAQGSMSPNGVPQQVMSPYNAMPAQVPTGRANRMGMMGAPSQWNDNAGFNTAAFGLNGGLNGDIGSPQRNQAYNMLNGMQNFQAPNGFDGSQFSDVSRQGAPYGHF